MKNWYKMMPKGQKVFVYFVSIVATVLSLSACASSPRPQSVGGKYYMMGDSNCARYRQISDRRIMCYTKDDEQVGYRDAMTDQDISMYQFNQQRAQQESAEFNQALQNFNNNLQRSNEQTNYNTQQMMNNINNLNRR
jgi:hypothetical protein